MALKAAPFYWITCDDCGAKSTEGTEYAAWGEADGAYEDATDQEWYCQDGHDWCEVCRYKHVCSECEKVTDGLVPLEEDGYWPVCRECKGGRRERVDAA